MQLYIFHQCIEDLEKDWCKEELFMYRDVETHHFNFFTTTKSSFENVVESLSSSGCAIYSPSALVVSLFMNVWQ